MSIKVYGGTAASADLCEGCEHLKRMQGQRESDELRFCGNDENPVSRIPFKMARCSFHKPKDYDATAHGKPLLLYFDGSRDKLMIYRGPFSEPITADQHRAQFERRETPATNENAAQPAAVVN